MAIVCALLSGRFSRFKSLENTERYHEVVDFILQYCTLSFVSLLCCHLLELNELANLSDREVESNFLTIGNDNQTYDNIEVQKLL